MPLFGKKKKESGTDIEAAEEDGLLMQTGGVSPPAEDAAPEPPVAADEADREPVDLDEPLSEDAEAALAGLDESDGEEAGIKEAGGESTPDEASAASPNEESGEDEILSMFSDSEAYGDLAELTKDLDEVSASDLLAELREIRSMLPADALEDQQAA